MKVWWRYSNSDTKKKPNKINGLSITFSYIRHFNTSKCVYQLDTHSVNVWWKSVLPNINAPHFCDIFSYIAQAPTKTGVGFRRATDDGQNSKITDRFFFGNNQIEITTFRKDTKYWRKVIWLQWDPHNSNVIQTWITYRNSKKDHNMWPIWV